jgi:hypothetical protein
MSNIDQSKLTEMLRLARASLNEEFLQKQTEAYQQWYISSNQTWKTSGTLLPPHSAKLVYPTEKDIVQRALEIYNTLTPATTVKNTAQQTAAESMPGELFVESVVEPAVVIEPTAEIVDEVIEPVAEPAVEPIEPSPVEPEVVAPVVQEITPEEKEKEKQNRLINLLTKWGGKGTI